MKPYEWMVDFTPQTVWIEKKGLLVWLAEVSGSLGGGLYLIALYFQSMTGMVMGWLIIALFKGAFHAAHLGQPRRFWRLALKPGSSWLARGFIIIIAFALSGAGQLFVSYLIPGTIWESALKVLTGVMAFLVIGYAGFLMNYVRGIPLWSSGLLPILFVSFGLGGGAALMLLIHVFGYASVDSKALLTGFRVIACINAVLVTTYLWIASYGSPTGEQSVKELTEGHTAPFLWLGVFFCGIILPLGVSVTDYFIGSTPPSWLGLASIGAVVGVFSLNYCLLKGGLYGPLISRSR